VLTQDNELTIEPSLDYNAPNGVEVTVTADDGTDVTPHTFTVTVTPVNDAPTVVELIPDVTIPEESDLTIVADLDDIFADVDLGDEIPDELTFTLEGIENEMNMIIDDDHVLQLTPDHDYYIEDGVEITVTAEDNGGESISDAFILIIEPEPAMIEFSVEEIDFDIVFGGNPAEEEITVRNIGSLPLEIQDAVIEGEGFSVEWDEGVVLERYDETIITVEFDPQRIGVHEGTLTVSSNDEDRPEVEIPLTGDARLATIVANPEVLDFGEVYVNVETRREVELINLGNIDLTIEDIVPSSEQFWFDVDFQPEFNWEFVETDLSMSIIYNEAILNGESLIEDDFIGVFTPGGLCAGFAQFNPDENGFAIWGDDAETMEIDGFRAGEALEFRYWDESAGREIFAEANYEEGDGNFVANGLAIVSLNADNEFMPLDLDEPIVLGPGDSYILSVFFQADERRDYDETLTVISDALHNPEYDIRLLGTGINAIPEVTALIDPMVIDEDAGLTQVVDLDDVFADPDGDELTYTVTGDPEEVNALIDGDNLFTVNSDENYNNPDGINMTITARDEDGESVETGFSLVITPVNDAPVVAQEIEDEVVAEDAGRVDIGNVYDFFFDVDGDELVLTFPDAPAEINIAVEDDILYFDADQDFNIPDGVDITVVAHDAEDVTVEDVFNLTIIPVNDTPVVVDRIDDVTVDEDPGLTVVVDLDDVFFDIDGDALTYDFADAPAELNMDIDGDGVLTFEPELNFNIPGGVDITVTAEDPNGETVDDVFMLTITPVNDAPMLVDPIADVTVDEDPGLTLVVDLDDVFTDPEGDPVSYEVTGAPDEINMIIDGDNVLQFDPDRDFNLVNGVEITITAEDDQRASTDDMFTLIITPVNDAPVVAEEIADVTVDEDPGLTVVADLDQIFFDVDGDVLTYSFANAPDELNMDIDEDGVLTFDPDQDYNIPGGVAITVTAEDPDAESVPDVFTLVITPVNDAPVVVNPIENVIINEDNGELVIADLNDVYFDVDGDELEFRIIDAPNRLNADLLGGTVLAITPDDNYNLPDGADVVISATDQIEVTPTTFVVTITPMNDPPFVVAEIDDITLDEDSGQNILVDLDDVFDDIDFGDVNPDELTFSFQGDDNDMNMAIDGENVLLVDLAPDYYTPEGVEITVTAEDQGGETVDDMFILTVEPSLPQISIEENAHDFGDVMVDDFGEWVFTIENIGSQVLDIQDITIDGQYYSVDFQQDVSLQRNETTEVIVTFAPRDVGQFDGELHVLSNSDIDANFQINLTGVGVMAAYTVNPDVLDFGEVYVHASANRDFEITNIGNDELTIDDIIPSSEQFEIVVDLDREFDWEFVETGEGMTIIVNGYELNGEILADEDFIGAFTPGGICAGFSQVSDEQGGMIGMAIWPDDDQTEEVIEGFQANEEIEYRFWDTSSNREYVAEPTYEEGNGQFMRDGFAIVSLEVNQGMMPDDLEEPIVLQPDESFLVTVIFTPDDRVEYDEVLNFDSNIPDEFEAEIQLLGIGINNPPRVVQPIDPMNIPEDSDPVEVVDLDDVFEDLDGDELEYSLDDVPMEITALIDGDNVFSIEPDDDYNNLNGDDITIVADDGFGGRVSTVFTVIVEPENDAPIIINDLVDMNVNEDAGVVRVGDLDNFFDDIDGDDLSYEFANAPDEVNMEIDGNNVMSFESDLNYNLPDGVEITVTALDPSELRVEQTFMLTILPVNDAPVVDQPLADIEVDEDPGFVLISNLDVNFFDVDGDDLEYSITGAPAELNMVIDDDNFLSFEPDLNFNIPNGINIRITATDPDEEAVSDVFNLVINPVDDAPMLVGELEDITVEEDHGLYVIGDLDDIIVDPEGDPIEFVVMGDPIELNMIIDDDDVLSFNADENFNIPGGVEITLTATDTDHNNPSEFFFTVIITPENDPPMLIGDIEDVTVDEDPGRVDIIDLDEVFDDVDDADLVFTHNAPDELNFVIDGENLMFFDPDANFFLNAPVDVTVRATDGAGLFLEVTFAVMVNAVNDAPIVVAPIDDQNVDEGNGLINLGNLNNLFIDIENEAMIFSVVQAENELNADIIANELILDPDENYNVPGGVEVIVSADDQNGGVTTDEFMIVINAVNDEPFVQNPVEDLVVAEDSGLTIIGDLDEVFDDIDLGDADPDMLTFEFAGDVNELNMLLDVENVLSINPDQDYFNEQGILITLTATDQADAFVIDEFTIVITPQPSMIVVVERDHDFGAVIAGESSDWSFNILNEGSVDLVINSIEAAGQYYSVDFDQEIRLQGHEDVDVVATFAPMNLGDFNGQITIQSDAENEPEIAIDLTGSGLMSIIAADPDFLDFGGVLLANQERRDFEISNNGNHDLVITEITPSSDRFRVVPNLQDDPLVIAAGGTEVIEAYFTPLERIEYNEILTIVSDALLTPEIEVAVTGIGLNNVPVVDNPIDDIVVDEDSEQTVIADLDVVFFEPDGDELEFTIDGDPDELNLMIDGENVLTLEPAEDYNLENGAQVTITADDGFGGSVEEQFTITVTPVPDSPEILQNFDDIIVNEDSGPRVVGDLDDYFFDVDGDVLNYFVEDPVEELNLIIDDDNILTFDPALNFNDPDGVAVVVVAQDEGGLDVSNRFDIIIRPVNDPPVIVRDIEDVDMVEDQGFHQIADLDEVFFDIDGDVLVFNFDGATDELNMDISDENILSVDPDLNYRLPDGVDIEVSAEDEGGVVVDLTFRLTIEAQNDPPVVEAEIEDVIVNEDAGRTDIVDLLNVFSDIDEDVLTYRFTGVPDEVNMGVDNGSLLFIDPDQDYFTLEPLEITIIARDAHGLTVDDVFMLTINPLNDAPYFIDPIADIAVPEAELVQFELVVGDPDELLRDPLTITMIDDGGTAERGATFEQVGLITGVFNWVTSLEDEGVYNTVFQVEDEAGEAVQTGVEITVTRVNQAPVWVEFPVDNFVMGYIEDVIEFSMTASDPEDDQLQFAYELLGDVPQGLDVDAVEDVNTITFSMQPDRFQSGEFVVRATVSDADFSTDIDINVEISPSYFRYVMTGTAHTVSITDVYYFRGEDGQNTPDVMDELAIRTPDGVVAGSYIFAGDPIEFEVTVYGDDPETQEIEGFVDEEFSFRYYDRDMDRELQVLSNLQAGEANWRHGGVSVFDLYIGPALEADVNILEFGLQDIEEPVQLPVTFRSTGTIGIVDLVLSLEGEGFVIDEEGPVNLAPGEELNVNVTFQPQNLGDYAATLTATSEFAEVSIDLTGTAIEVGNLEFEVTETFSTIRVVHADVFGDRLGEGDEIGVFTPGDICAGGIVLDEDAPVGIAPWVLTAYGDDPETEQVVEGFVADEAYSFKIWDEDTESEIEARAIYFSGSRVWNDGATSVVALTSVEQQFAWLETDLAHHLRVEEVDFMGEPLSAGDEIAVFTPRQIAAGGILIEGDAPYEFDAYGDDPDTDEVIEGFQDGEVIHFRIWDAENGQEILARAEWLQGPEMWEADGQTRLNLLVARDNLAPEWRPADDVFSREGAEISFNVVAFDFDGDEVSLRISPEGAAENMVFADLGEGVGSFEWTPTFDQAGQHDVTFIASDGMDETPLEIMFVIRNQNRAPVLAEIGDRQIPEDELFQLQLMAEDPDNDNIAFIGENLPEGAILEGDLFTWVPTFEQAGVYEDITFTVVDFSQPRMSDEETITITVTDVNRLPVWDRLNPIAAGEDALIQFDVQAVDPDGDQLQLSAENLPGNAQFNVIGAGTGRFTWQTDYESRGEYIVDFIADDQRGDPVVLQAEITVRNVNRRPFIVEIGNLQARVGVEFQTVIEAVDPDIGEQEQLEVVAANLPPNAVFDYQGDGIGTLTWNPTWREARAYPEVLFTVVDPNGAQASESIVMTAIIDDNAGPDIANLLPENDSFVESLLPEITADITDEFTGISRIDLFVDNEFYDNYDFDEETGEFVWQAEIEMAEGPHNFFIQAFDNAGNGSIAINEFIVNVDAGVIDVDVDRFVLLDRINIEGMVEPFLHVELWRTDENFEPIGGVFAEMDADEDGYFLFRRTPLEERDNFFLLTGTDVGGLEPEPVQLNIYRDIHPPVAELVSPEELTNDNTPEIRALVSDEGVGIDINDVSLTLDGELIVDLDFVDGEIIYQVPGVLDEGDHLITISVADLLGNVTEDPIDLTFFVDSNAPVVEHAFLDDDFEAIANPRPTLTFGVSDPFPSSGIVVEDIVLTFDDEELEFVWNEVRGTVVYEFVEDIRNGVHELTLEVSDLAGNVFFGEGGFTKVDGEDVQGPFVMNPSPPDRFIVGNPEDQRRMGMLLPDVFEVVTADTVSFVIGDLDAGVDWATVRMVVNGDTIAVDQMIIEGDRVMVGVGGPDDGRLDPDAMLGLAEGTNNISAIGDDNVGQEGGMEWQFFLDETVPDAPVLNQPDPIYTNEQVITITGRTGGDMPEYEDDFEDRNIPIILIYLDGELRAYLEDENNAYNAEFEIPDIVLHEGENVLEATVVDAAGNESEFSEPIIIFLDENVPVIEEFAAVGGPRQITGRPEFAGSFLDIGSGIDVDDPDAITCMIGDLALDYDYDPESGDFSATLSQDDDDLEDGEYTAILTVTDRSANVAVAEYEFEVNATVPDVPEFVLQEWTSINRVVLDGTGEVGNEIGIFLNDEEIDVIDLNEAEFHYERIIRDLPDVSEVYLVADNGFGLRSDPTEPQTLRRDVQPPVFSNELPENGTVIDAGLLDEIEVFVEDADAGLDPDNFSILVRGEAVAVNAVEENNGYTLTSDVSDLEFGDNEAVDIVANARDLSVPANRRAFRWNLTTIIGNAPVVDIPDTSYMEDESLTLNLTHYINDEDHPWQNLDIATEIIEGDDFADIEYDNGILDITSGPDEFGLVRVNVTATDPTNLIGEGIAVINVLPVNDPPVLEEIEGQFATVDELYELQIVANDADPGDDLTFHDNTEIFDITEDGLISFEPDMGMRGRHEVTVTVTDEADASDEMTFTMIIVLSNNEIELADPIEDIEVDEDADPFDLGVLEDRFVDPDGFPLNFDVDYDGEDEHDGIWINIDQATSDATLFFMPDYNGEVNVTITADDRSGSIVENDFLVTVNPVNDPPERIGILPRNLRYDEDPGRVVIADLDSVWTDVDEEGVDYDIDFGDEDNLGIDIDENNILSITPDDDWFGEQMFSLLVDDGVNVVVQRGPRQVAGDFDADARFQRFIPGDGQPQRDEITPMDITVFIRSVNDAPRPVDQGIPDQEYEEDTWQNEPWTITLPDHLFDVEGDEIVFTAEGDDPLVLEVVDNTTLNISVPEHFFGDNLSVTATATDSEGASYDDEFLVSITGINDPPIQVGDLEEEYIEDEDVGLVIIADLDDIFTEVENEEIEFTFDLGGEDNNIGLNIDDENVLSFTPLDNWHGQQVFILSADDGVEVNRQVRRGPRRVSPVDEGARNIENWVRRAPFRDEATTVEITVTINSVNDLPEILGEGIPDQEYVEDTGPWELDMDDFFFDADMDLRYEVFPDDQLETDVADDTNILTISVEEHFFGDALPVTVRAIDSENEQVEDTFLITITPVNDPPLVEVPIPDQPDADNGREWIEDNGPWVLGQYPLNEVFWDPDDPFDALVFTFDGPDSMTIDYDEETTIMTLSAVPNFNEANFEITVTAEDGHEEERLAVFRARGFERDPNVAQDSGPSRRMRSIAGLNRAFSGSAMNLIGGFERELNPRRDISTDEIFLLTIDAVPDDPFWAPDDLHEIEVDELDLVDFVLTADDPDLDYEGDVLGVALIDDAGIGNLGAQIDIDQGTHQISVNWQTTHDHSGVYVLTSRATDEIGNEVDYLTTITVNNVNRAPDLAIQPPDMQFDEDGPEQLVGLLNDIFVDQDGDELLFTVSENDTIISRIENGNLFIRPVPNANGTTQIIITADDQNEENNITTDTLRIDIQWINDLPTEFTLLRPTGIDTLASRIAVQFVWERSIDTVEDSTMTYQLVVTIDGQDTIRVADLADTTRRIRREDLSTNGDDGTLIEWYVLANDGVEDLQSDTTYTFWLRPLDVEDIPEELVPTELVLGPIYPNPFNDQVTIRYGLPVKGDAVITIHDQLGREVTRFTREGLAAGYYGIVWNGSSRNGTKVSSGLYIARIVTADAVRMQRLVLMR